MSNLFISNVVFDFDESKSIDSLSSCMSPDELQAFRAGGFEYYVNESRDVYAVCEKAAAKVLDESHVGREDVTDIVYISSTKFIDKVVGLSVYLSKLAANIGIHKATLYALSAGSAVISFMPCVFVGRSCRSAQTARFCWYSQKS